MNHDEEHARLIAEVRYAERLAQRTARLYRRVATAGTFFAVLGGSAVVSALADQVPVWVSLSGAALLTAAGAVVLAVRPVEKAVANEMDVRRYASLRSRGLTMPSEELRVALANAHESAAPEIEALRAVAYNDAVQEIGREDQAIALGPLQRVMAALA